LNSATPINREHATNVGVRNFVLLFLGCLLFHIAGTWSLPLIDRDEPRFAEAAREMRQRGDYIIPYFNNQYRFDKPPLTYWLQTASYRAFGENDFAARFPSAVAAALVSILLLAWGRRMANGHVGWRAAIIFSLCLQTFMHAKAAVADMWLVFFVSAAHWAGWELLSGKRGNRPISHWWWIFYAALAAAFLAKGPIGWTPLLTIAAATFFLPETKLRNRFAFIRGILLTLAIVCLWGIPALLRTHGEFFRVGIGHHVVGRSLATMEGHGASSLLVYLLTLPFYFVTVFVSFFPWSIKLPWLTRHLRRQRDATDNYLIAGTAIIFLLFTLVRTKLPHYTLPAFPLLALLLARHWAPQGAALSKVPATAVENRRSLTATPAIITAGIYLALALFGFPLTRQFFPSVQLFGVSRNDVTTEMQFGAVGYNEPSLVWYFRDRTNGFFDSALNAKNVQPFMAEDGARFVIVPTAMIGKIFPAIPPRWKSFRTEGFNIAKGKRLDLTLILKPE
jgi:4-amino-4-deoxy-L-arabinose transferase-like glycosyltransferase